MRAVGVTPDHGRGAGYALLEVDEAVRDAQIEFAFCDVDRGYLWPSSPARTTWRKEPYYFKVMRAEAEKPIFRLGPKICNYLAPDSLIDIRSRDGDIAQGLTWIGVPVLVVDEEDNEIIDLPRPPSPPPPPRTPPPPPPMDEAGRHKQDLATPSRNVSSDERGDADVGFTGPRKRSRTKLWLRRASSIVAMLVATFVWALSQGLDWQVNAPDPIVFQRTATGYAPDEVKVLIKRAWWAAWIDTFIDPRVQLIGREPVYASNYQAGSVRTFDLRLGLPSDVSETDISFRHPATNVAFGRRHVSIRSMPGELVVAATDELKFSGPKSGPFVPNTIRLTISSRGAGFLWSVVGKPDWLSVTPDSDFISRNGTQDIHITTSAAAALKDPGSYPDTLVIKSPTSGVRLAILLLVETPAPAVDPVVRCDALAGSRFDADRPNTAPPVENMLVISDADVDAAIAACGAASASKGSRRFYAQLGRAYATKAEKQAIAGNDNAARATMDLALSAWRKAVSQGSGSAMNFLGAYNLGTYNDEIAPGRARAGLPPFTFISPNLDTALGFFRDAARNSNISGMRNAGGLLLGDMDPPPSFQSIPEGVEFLKKAVSAGDSKAAVVLGKAFYTGSPKDVLRYAESSPQPREQALQLLGKACSDATDLGARSSAKEFLDKVSSRTYVGSGGKLEPSRRPAECS